MQFTSPTPEPAREPVETAISALGMAEMFAVWAVRLWVAAYRGSGNLLPQLRHGFALAGMPKAWLELDEFLTRLLGSVKRPLDIRSVTNPLLSPDERGMLHWLGGLQRNDLPPSDCPYLKAIAIPGRQLAGSFATSGLRFRAGDPAGEEGQRVVH